MFRSRKIQVALVMSLMLIVAISSAVTVPTWRYNDHPAGAVKFFDSAPWDQQSAGPSFIEVEARADTVRISWHYYNGTSWVAMNGKVAYGDTNYIVPPGGVVTFKFSYPKPDAGYLSGGTARIWAE